jgi:hypothetical protein
LIEAITWRTREKVWKPFPQKSEKFQEDMHSPNVIDCIEGFRGIEICNFEPTLLPLPFELFISFRISIGTEANLWYHN